ncbi:ribonuclease H2 subunit C [Histomonas meleagridis]|uniref:ribonuclease H2 subunit C n=1 Tax=Histomonas meleagridis TaxID=135588 RepID=UPI00355981AA|nr:ribonuclease H2 subunit C [Histomonas meleagridis]KAH0799926.1 ribonuclease H2 subunit C [Histomonas meleagridis]
MSQPLKAEWIPAHINYDGPAKVSQYFDSRISENKNGQYIGFFRGHQLFGKYLELPDGYKPVIVTTDEGELKKIADVGQVRLWDLDTPSLEFSLQCTDVIKVSDILAED